MARFSRSANWPLLGTWPGPNRGSRSPAPKFSAVRWICASGLALGCSSEPLQDPGSPESLAEALLPSNAALTTLFEPTGPRSATALAFNPAVRGELWVTLRQFLNDAPCTPAVSTGCAALPGEMAILAAADSEAPEARIARDGNAWHFMRRPTSIAFGTNGNLATCGEARTGNYDDDPIDFHGPVLWSSDPAIFGVRPQPGQNGTHLDMLHSTPFCMGIAHERDNVYWAFNGQVGALDRYDFNQPHEIGGEDHTDGEIYRYLEGELSRVPEVPSHLVLDEARKFLYASDTGNARVLRLDIQTGSPNGEIDQYDGIAVHLRMGGAEFVSIIDAASLRAPSGIALVSGILLVADNADGSVHAFTSNGSQLRSFDTGLASGALGGIAVGPDNKVYLSDLLSGRVYRLDTP